MTDKEKQISRRKALAAIGTAGVAAAGSGAGTYAYLSSEERVGIAFTSGNIQLVIVDDNTLKFVGDDGKPKTASVKVQNDGTLTAGEVAWTALSLSGDTNLASSTVINEVTYRGTDITSDITADGRTNLQALSDYLANGSEFGLETLVGGDGLQGNGQDVATLQITAEIDYTNVEGEGPYTLTGEATLVSKQISPGQ